MSVEDPVAPGAGLPASAAAPLVLPPFVRLVDVTRVVEPVVDPARPDVDGMSCAGSSGLLAFGPATAAPAVTRLAMRTAIAIPGARMRFRPPLLASTLVSFRLPKLPT